MEKRVLILFVTFYVILEYVLGKTPERCYGTTELLTRQCCIFPPFFKREIAKMCGARVIIKFINNDSNVTGLRRDARDPCEHWTCMLQKYALLTAEQKLDEDKYYRHLDKWVNLNPEFSKVMYNAKINCKHLYRMFMPLEACEFRHLQSCLRNYINVNCPKVIPTAQCRELKVFYEECGQHYVNK